MRLRSVTRLTSISTRRGLDLDGVAEHGPHATDLRPAAQREGLVVEAGVLGVAGGHRIGIEPFKRRVQALDGLTAHCQLTAAMSLAKIGELDHSPFRPFLATATWTD